MWTSRRLVGLAIFFIGVFACVAQVLFARESIVVFGGNELNIGSALSGWLVGVFAGAMPVRLFMRRDRSEPALHNALLAVLFAGLLFLPVQIWMFRSARTILGVHPGEYVPAGSSLFAAFLFMLPSSMMIGSAFPLACELYRKLMPRPEAGEESTGIIYSLESIGSMCGGIVLTFVLLPLLDASALFLCLMCAGLVAVVSLVKRRWARLLAAGILAVCLTGLCFPNLPLQKLNNLLSDMRWRDFGVLVDGSQVVASQDSPYQNLAVIERHGQFALFVNGQASAVFPDANTEEHRVHFVMAQKPDAKSILLLGGNPVGDLPQYLKYGIRKIVYVEIDPVLLAIYRDVCGEAYKAAVSDPRVEVVTEDAQKYVNHCKEQFDVVILNAPQPTGMGSNRFYVESFFKTVRELMAPEGFFCVSLVSAVRLESEVVDMVASVWKSLRAVFPVVLVTAGENNTFFCGSSGSGITLDGPELFQRSKASGVKNQFFMPEHFLASESLDPAYVEKAVKKFEASLVSANTVVRPVAYYYNLILWSRFSGSGLDRVLDLVLRGGRSLVSRGIILLITIVLLAGCVVWAAGRKLRTLPGVWARCMLVLALAATGYCGMSIELIAIFVFQSHYGYVYLMLGLIMSAFMLGLVLGSVAGRRAAGVASHRARWVFVLSVQVMLFLLPILLGRLVAINAWERFGWKTGLTGVIVILGVVFLTGLLVGAQFLLINRLFRDSGGEWGHAASLGEAFDHIGAALGAGLTGVILVPVLGVGVACAILGQVALAGLAMLASAGMAVVALRLK